MDFRNAFIDEIHKLGACAETGKKKRGWTRWSPEQARAEAEKLNKLIKRHGGVRAGVDAYNKKKV